MTTRSIVIHVNGSAVKVPAGCSVAAALFIARPPGCTRRSVSGEARAPVCGMGVCQECRVVVDGLQRLACQVAAREGMRVETGA